jgi:hypothetical protein
MSSIASITAEVHIIFGACEVGEFDLLMRYKNTLPHLCDCESFNPFSGGFIISSHIYKGEFPLPPAGI